MKTILRNASRATQPVYDIVSGLFTGPGAIGLAFLPLVLGVTTTAFLGFVATETGRAILDEVRRRGRPAAPRPAAPSLPAVGSTSDPDLVMPGFSPSHIWHHGFLDKTPPFPHTPLP